MPYAPTPEKLAGLGLLPKSRTGGYRASFHRAHPKTGHTTHVIHCYADRMLRLISHLPKMRVEFAGRCPTEAFFDELLITVGWQPRP